MNPVLLINPNSNADTTARMCAIAARALPVEPMAWTAPHGPALIVTPDALRAAADLVAEADFGPAPKAIILAAFGDPGADRLSRRMPCPVIGIGAAAARAAAGDGLPFAVATTTPLLRGAIDALMRHHAGGTPYLGSFCSTTDPAILMADQSALDAALLVQIDAARAAGAAHVIIGGGPLGDAADRLRNQSPLPLFNPVLCAAHAVAALIARPYD